MAIDRNHKASTSMKEAVADRPASKEKTKQVTVYLPESKWRKLKMAAISRDTSMTGLLASMVDQLDEQ